MKILIGLNCNVDIFPDFRLTNLYNLSLRDWVIKFRRESFVIPVSKNESKAVVFNYKYIATTKAILKLFEKILTHVLYYQTSFLLSSYQHRFRKSRSPLTNILEVAIVVNESVMFCYKNKHLELSDFYISQRTQQVKLENVTTKLIQVNSGVPQGSHLFSILFINFINIMLSVVYNSKMSAYTNERTLKIFFSIVQFQFTEIKYKEM